MGDDGGGRVGDDGDWWAGEEREEGGGSPHDDGAGELHDVMKVRVYKSIADACTNIIDKGILRSYVPLNKYCVKPIRAVKGFNGRFE